MARRNPIPLSETIFESGEVRIDEHVRERDIGAPSLQIRLWVHESAWIPGPVLQLEEQRRPGPEWVLAGYMDMNMPFADDEQTEFSVANAMLMPQFHNTRTGALLYSAAADAAAKRGGPMVSDPFARSDEANRLWASKTLRRYYDVTADEGWDLMRPKEAAVPTNPLPSSDTDWHGHLAHRRVLVGQPGDADHMVLFEAYVRGSAIKDRERGDPDWPPHDLIPASSHTAMSIASIASEDPPPDAALVGVAGIAPADDYEAGEGLPPRFWIIVQWHLPEAHIDAGIPEYLLSLLWDFAWKNDFAIAYTDPSNDMGTSLEDAWADDRLHSVHIPDEPIQYGRLLDWEFKDEYGEGWLVFHRPPE